ncbi:MAG: LysR family transcriptional regulator [Clostridia bacterium]|nr:LysR family transcriptional regulator [Clostridia bacterium]
MTERHIEYVLTIAREGSITAASRKLYVSQPSLSQTIKLIERNLGAEIFNRRTEPISITPAGEMYIEAAQKVLAIEEALRKEIGRMNQNAV